MAESQCVRVAAFVLAILCAALPAAAQSTTHTPITFKRTVLDTLFRSEGVAVGDFNNDGKRDIAAGTVWYAAPDWKMQLAGEKAPEYDPLNYSHAFQTFADDLNGDGWTDLIVVDWPGAFHTALCPRHRPGGCQRRRPPRPSLQGGVVGSARTGERKRVEISSGKPGRRLCPDVCLRHRRRRR